MAAAAREQRSGAERGRVASPTQRNATSPSAREHAELPRSASFTYLGPAKDGAYEQYGQPNIVEIRIPSANYVAHSSDAADLSPSDTDTPARSACPTPDEHVAAVAPPQVSEIIDQLRGSSADGQRNQRNDDARSSLESSIRDSRASVESNRTVSTAASTPVSSQRPSVNKSFSRPFSKRQSWHQSMSSTPSRSPSPVKPESAFSSDETLDEARPTLQRSDSGRRKSLVRRLSVKLTKDSKSKRDASSSGDEDGGKPGHHRTAFLRRKSSHGGSAIPKLTNAENKADHVPPVPAMPKLPKSFSTDRLPVVRVGSGTTDRAAPMPKMLTPDKEHRSSPLSMMRKKDELWSVFRSLDADYAKFTAKSSAFKANVVRNSLIPFLRTYATHPSNRTLRLEDLDRRANILNKWWTGLIELLHGRNNQSISGTDRPVILDGVSGIMERPEWRLSPSPFCALKDRVKVSAAGSQSSTSLGSMSTSSDFLSESVHHNVRNIFVQNLSSQMAFVVDKMSLRQASASLVAFCGKACAYAFMFVPGMADVLVRLWDLSMDTIRRVLAESGIEKFDQMDDSNDQLVNFPPALHQLGFTSLMKIVRRLRTPPPLPLGTTHVDWWGHWVERWSGRESDLFYMFVKQFHVLTTDFLNPESTEKEQMCAPGLLLVHAQILTNLDATIHREANQANQGAAASSSSTTFDELLGDVDATASTFPILPNNAVRLMAENRLIMLIRDFLSDRTSDHPIARELFAQSFNRLLQAATRGTSMFDHNACNTLLDFLEEALVILVRYEQLRDDGPLIDSNFWHTVCRKMIESENTMTEIRLYAFLHTVWNVLVPDTGRKSALCTSVLLDPEVFESRFNHWCPMVRAYFMRLICWRVARYDGEEHGGDLEVLEVIQERLRTTWSHYLYLCNQAEREQGLQPVTTPCNPAPGRRLLIVRTDNQVTHNNTFLSFDGILRAGESPTQSKEPPWKRASMAANLIDTIEMRPASAASSFVESDTESQEKGIGGFLRKMMGGRSKSQDPSKGNTPDDKTKPLPKDPHAVTRAATADEVSSPPDTPAKPSTAPVPQFRSLSFKFSLEFQPGNKSQPPLRLFPPRLPLAAQVYLQNSTKKFNSNGAVIPTRPAKPMGESVARSRYAGRALAEWAVVIGECQSFFERRKKEGVPSEKLVETPTLGVENFKRPG